MTVAGYGSRLPIDRKTATLDRREEDYNANADPNYMDYCNKQCVLKRFYELQALWVEGTAMTFSGSWIYTGRKHMIHLAGTPTYECWHLF